MILQQTYRTFRNVKGNWSDPLEDYGKSTTYHFDDHAKEFDTKTDMIIKIKDDKTITFKESELSEETKKEMDKQNIVYEKDIKSIDTNKMK